MRVVKLLDDRPGAMPLLVALPYGIEAPEDAQPVVMYDPQMQRPLNAGRDYSTSRDDDSAQTRWFTSKSDTKKDD